MRGGRHSLRWQALPTMPRAWPARARAFGLGLAALLIIPPAAAQDIQPVASAALRCLQPPPAQRGVPEYPFLEWKTGEKGRVKVELEFTLPDRRPAVKVLEREGPGSMVDAVREHVRTWRAPCLTDAEVAARLQIEFVFTADDRQVHWSRPVDADEEVRKAMISCLVHASGEKTPEYPNRLLWLEEQGRVLARMRFVAPDQPPQVETFARPSAKNLARHIRQWAAGWRMPCHSGAPVQTEGVYVFRFEGQARGFRPLELVELMSIVRGVRSQTLAFDTRTMGCPFDLKFGYFQTFAPNTVGEVGGTNPARRPLLDWLAGVELDLPDKTLDMVFGDQTYVTVPCVKIDLKPKENS